MTDNKQIQFMCAAIRKVYDNFNYATDDLCLDLAKEFYAAGIRVADDIRKHTAREILQSIAYCQTVSDVRGKRYNRYELDQKDFENIADRFGVEVDE